MYSYQRVLGLLTLASVSLLAVATHESTSGGAWLFSVFLSAIPCWFIFMIAVPPWLKQGRNQPRFTLVSAWLSAAMSVFLLEFLLFGAAHVLLGASQRELLEHLEMLSLPLAWISPNFLIEPACAHDGANPCPRVNDLSKIGFMGVPCLGCTTRNDHTRSRSAFTVPSCDVDSHSAWYKKSVRSPGLDL
jgi:hypothetical protein